mmetsp:Transcript_33788/g.73038  ORF Transcript_33788/g.73038 Transcript_33788/m.73038 type:complete len:208 (+) Transcript_33788:596-1219(+)
MARTSERMAPYASAKPLCTRRLPSTSILSSSSSSSKSEGRNGNNSLLQHCARRRQHPGKPASSSPVISLEPFPLCKGTAAPAVGEKGLVRTCRTSVRDSVGALHNASTFGSRSKHATGPSQMPKGPVLDSSAKGCSDMRTSVTIFLTLAVPRNATTMETSLVDLEEDEVLAGLCAALDPSPSWLVSLPICSASNQCTSSCGHPPLTE